MAINFPSSPTLNQLFTTGQTTYQWDGSSWEVAYIVSNPNGIAANTPNALTIGSGLTGGSFNGSAPVTIALDTSGLVTPSSTETLSNKTLTDPTIIGTIKEDVFTITDGAAFEIDPANGSIQLITLGANRTPKATNFLAGEAVTLMVLDGSAFTLTWTDATFGGSGVVWVGGTAPTLDTTKYTVIELWKVGTQVYGALVGAA